MTAMPRLSSRARHELRRMDAVPLARSSPVKVPTRAWLDLLHGLARFEQIRLETQNPGVSLTQASVLNGVRVCRGVGIVEGRRCALSLCFDAWHGVREHWPCGAADVPQLAIEDAHGNCLLSLSTESAASRFVWRPLLHSFHASMAKSAIGEVDASNDRCDLACAEPSAPMGGELWRRDVDELCGRARLDVGRLEPFGRLASVRQDRLPDLLEAIAHQALGLRLLTGTEGVAQCCDVAFTRCLGRGTGLLQLEGEAVQLRIRTAAVAGLCVFVPSASTAARRQLRLYDSAGHALLFVEDRPGFRNGEDPLWRTLLNTLLD